MADVLWFDGRFTTTDEPVLTVADRAVLFGDAVYEVIKFVDRVPILLEAHWQRLCRSLDLLEIRNPWQPKEFVSLVLELISRGQVSAGILYLQVSRGGGVRSHAWSDELSPVAFIYASEFRFPDKAMRDEGVGIVTVPESRWARCEIKSTNLLPNAIAKKTARRAGAYEAVFVRDGFVVEGASSNIFAVINGILVTPELGSGLLPGIVRAAVIDLARESELVVNERPLPLSELKDASEVLLTSTTSSVLPVTSVDNRKVGPGTRGWVTRALQEAFAGLEERHAARLAPIAD